MLDQIELFAKSKQNLLYSLLNLMQEREMSVAIIGIASVLVFPHHDADQPGGFILTTFCLWFGPQHIMDMLEKRVKSRFSDRYTLFLPNSSIERAQHILRFLFYLVMAAHTPFSHVSINNLIALHDLEMSYSFHLT